MRLGEIRESLDGAVSKLASTAADTRAAVIAVAVLGVVALVVGLIALGTSMRARTA